MIALSAIRKREKKTTTPVLYVINRGDLLKIDNILSNYNKGIENGV